MTKLTPTMEYHLFRVARNGASGVLQDTATHQTMNALVKCGLVTFQIMGRRYIATEAGIAAVQL